MKHVEQRAAVVAEARSWIGTPYAHAANIKGVGVDCAMILIEVFAACGLIERFDPRPYPEAWHLHQIEERYLNLIVTCGAREIAEADALPGDIVVWKVEHCFAHGGIITGRRLPLPSRAWVEPATGWPFVVHAFKQYRCVDESNAALAGQFTDPVHPRRFFSLWSAA